MVNGFQPAQANSTFHTEDGLPTWPCSRCQDVAWRKLNGQTVCGSCYDYGERLRAARELEQAR